MGVTQNPTFHYYLKVLTKPAMATVSTSTGRWKRGKTAMLWKVGGCLCLRGGKTVLKKRNGFLCRWVVYDYVALEYISGVPIRAIRNKKQGKILNCHGSIAPATGAIWACRSQLAPRKRPGTRTVGWTTWRAFPGFCAENTLNQFPA